MLCIRCYGRSPFGLRVKSFHNCNFIKNQKREAGNPADGAGYLFVFTVKFKVKIFLFWCFKAVKLVKKQLKVRSGDLQVY